jgi:hypothetical protein
METRNGSLRSSRTTPLDQTSLEVALRPSNRKGQAIAGASMPAVGEHYTPLTKGDAYYAVLAIHHP